VRFDSATLGCNSGLFTNWTITSHWCSANPYKERINQAKCGLKLFYCAKCLFSTCQADSLHTLERVHIKELRHSKGLWRGTGSFDHFYTNAEESKMVVSGQGTLTEVRVSDTCSDRVWWALNTNFTTKFKTLSRFQNVSLVNDIEQSSKATNDRFKPGAFFVSSIILRAKHELTSKEASKSILCDYCRSDLQ